MTPRTVALCVLLAACVARAQGAAVPPPEGASSDDAPVLAFTIWPDSEGVDRPHRVTVSFLRTLPLGGALYGYYRVQVLGLAGDVLIHTPAALPPDVQLRDLRSQADDVARWMARKARFSCDSLRPRKPAQTFGMVCA